jgi:hypothetical protein
LTATGTTPAWSAPRNATEHQQQDALLAPQAEAEQRGGEAARLRFERGVTEAGAVVDVRELGGAAGVHVEQVAGEIERFGRRWHRWRPDGAGDAR